ncbi:DciA family protein [Acinetobacter pragensis]|uniref:DciA family protein n=1 Tax=Acinetobacter pragensis TaxID=1806892 RepID=UPI003340E5BC
MSEPLNVFQQTRKHIKTGNFSFLSTQVAAWQKLTKLVQPLLPQPEQWQVVCYQNGVLMLTGENQALVSQLAYLQKQYIDQLSQIHELKELNKIQVRLRVPSQTQPPLEKASEPLSAETQDLLRNAADFVSDPKLSQAMLRLASNKK